MIRRLVTLEMGTRRDFIADQSKRYALELAMIIGQSVRTAHVSSVVLVTDKFQGQFGFHIFRKSNSLRSDIVCFFIVDPNLRAFLLGNNHA